MSGHRRDLRRAQMVGREFVRLYYNVMNSYSAYLYLFYEQDSSVVISESRDNEKPISMEASTQENVQQLLSWMYDDVSVNLLACIPQSSLNDSILLLISGRIKRKSYNQERFFNQALLLTKQEKGYYVKTDIMHVLSHTASQAYSLLPTPVQSIQSRGGISTNNPVERRDKRHQPMDSCGECHVELSSMHSKHAVGMDASPSSPLPHNQKWAPMIHERIDKMPEKQSGTPLPSYNQSDRTESKDATFSGGANLKDGEHRNLKSASVSVIPSSGLEDTGKRPHPSNNLNDEHMKMPELTSLFAARLPIGVTPDAVRKLFSGHGNLKKNNPVRVFTGLTNCYACVSFESEEEMRVALNTQIIIQGKEVVTEIWRPRDRRGRRIGRDMGSRLDTHTIYHHL